MRLLFREKLPHAVCLILAVLTIAQGFCVDKLTANQLIDLAKSKSSGLHDAITATFTDKDLKEGTAWCGTRA